MRKQNKLVAVLSTAALLAIGASMTSFAAGWAEEDGVWVYLDNDNERITDSWRRSGNNWYWLDDNGEMATDMLIEDDDNYYYVDANGAMVTNQWVAIENEDAGEDDEPDHYWYYFQANGRAYKRSDSAGADSLSARTINGKRYAFDTEGRMLYGWVYDGERQTDDDAWQTCEYYLGGEDDGAVAEGWQLISIVDEDMENAQPGDDYWDEEQDRWFYFQTSGRKVAADGDGDYYKSRTINGQRYGFDEYGRMIASWYADANPASLSEATQGIATYSESFMYFSSPEDGARYTRGWFKVVPGYYLDQSDYDDDEDNWYYADGDGNIVASEIRSINGRRYAFDEYGRMIDGLVFMTMTDHNEIGEVLDDDYYDTEDGFKDFANDNLAALSADTIRVSYFGDEDDGAMKTGRQTVEIDGENFTFEFKTGSSSRGAGLIGEDDGKLYLGGMLLTADRDDRYTVYKVTSNEEGDIEKIEEMDTQDFLDEATDGGEYDEDHEETVYTVKEDAYNDTTTYYLVNTSGSIVDNRSSAKDGEDYEFDVDDEVIQSVTLED